MKVTIVGTERSEGITKDKPGRPGGKPYAMGKLHAIVILDTSRNGEKASSKGYMGTTFENVDMEVVKRIEHNTFPMHAELVIEQVMRFGKLEGRVTDVRPLSLAKVPDAAPALKAA
jgi:hypothetical protein